MKKYVFKSLLCFLLIFAVFVLPGCSLFDNDDNLGNDSSSSNNSSNNSDIFYMNQVVTNSDGVKFSITNVQNTQQVGPASYGDNTENNFIIITIKIVNNSNKSVTIDTPELIRKSNGASYESEYLLSLDNQIVIYEEISSGITKSFNIAFETPTKSTDENYMIKIAYGKSSWYTNNYVKFLLKNK